LYELSFLHKAQKREYQLELKQAKIHAIRLLPILVSIALLWLALNPLSDSLADQNINLHTLQHIAIFAAG